MGSGTRRQVRLSPGDKEHLQAVEDGPSVRRLPQEPRLSGQGQPDGSPAPGSLAPLEGQTLQVLSLSPNNNSSLWLDLGLCSLEKGDPSLAKYAFKRAESDEGYDALISVFYLTGEYHGQSSWLLVLPFLSLLRVHKDGHGQGPLEQEVRLPQGEDPKYQRPLQVVPLSPFLLLFQGIP